MRLTNQVVEKLKPGASRIEIPDDNRPGLYLVVQPSGTKSWALRYRHGTKHRKLTLGSFPAVRLGESRDERKARLQRDPDSLSPDARELARAALDRIALGEDPHAEKIAERRGRAGAADLVRNVWGDYEQMHLATKRKATEAASKQIYRDYLSGWRDRRVSEIAKRDVLDVLDKLTKAGHPAAAKKARVVISHFFNWCKGRDLIKVSPCDGVKLAAPKNTEETSGRGERALSDAEIRILWKACDATAYPFGPFVKLLLLTGQRRNEVAHMRDAELNLAESTFTIPKHRAKNGREHVVHLSPLAVSIIKSLDRVANDEGFLFCTNGETGLSGFSACKKRLDATMLRIARKEAAKRGENPDDVKLAPWRLHDLRHTMITGMARIGVQIAVIEKCANHVSGTFSGIVRVYQNYTFAAEKSAAFDAWTAEVERITSQ